MPILEAESQRQLHLSRTVIHIDNSAEVGIAEVRYRIRSPSPVEGIHQVAAELQEHGLPELEALKHSEVLGGIPRSSQIAEESR
jgi:hypothetical protein